MFGKKKTKTQICGEHLKDGSGTLELINKVDEYKAEGIDITSEDVGKGSAIKVCVTTDDKDMLIKIKRELEKLRVNWDSLHVLIEK